MYFGYFFFKSAPHSPQYFESAGTRALQLGHIAKIVWGEVDAVVIETGGCGLSGGEAASPAIRTMKPIITIPKPAI